MNVISQEIILGFIGSWQLIVILISVLVLLLIPFIA